MSCLNEYLVYVCKYSAPLSNLALNRPGRHGLVPNFRSFHDLLARACGYLFLFLSVVDVFSVSFCGLNVRIVVLGSLGIRGWAQNIGEVLPKFPLKWQTRVDKGDMG